MDIANKKPPTRLQVPWNVHFSVWAFMIALSVSPALCVLRTAGSVESSEVVGDAIAAVVLMQCLLLITQRFCSSDALSYWEGLLIAAASMRTSIVPLSLVLSLCMLLLTVAASIVFVVTHDETRAEGHASIRFGRLIIGIYRGRPFK